MGEAARKKVQGQEQAEAAAVVGETLEVDLPAPTAERFSRMAELVARYREALAPSLQLLNEKEQAWNNAVTTFLEGRGVELANVTQLTPDLPNRRLLLQLKPVAAPPPPAPDAKAAAAESPAAQ